jgi:hypothetical protein
LDKSEDIKINITFIDFLFTLVIQYGFQGFLGEDWIEQGRFPVHSEIVSILIFVLGLLTVVLSWYGYHKSLTQRPNHYGVCEMFRFILDVVMLLLYGILLNKYNNLTFSLYMIILVFVLYIIWDVLGIIAHRSEASSGGAKRTYKRQKITFYCTVLLTLPIFFSNFNEILRIVYAIFIVTAYRILKITCREE